MSHASLRGGQLSPGGGKRHGAIREDLARVGILVPAVGRHQDFRAPTLFPRQGLRLGGLVFGGGDLLGFVQEDEGAFFVAHDHVGVLRVLDVAGEGTEMRFSVALNSSVTSRFCILFRITCISVEAIAHVPGS